jgi:hypothetical protein
MSFARFHSQREVFTMSSLPLPVLISLAALLLVGTIWFVWARKLPKK